MELASTGVVLGLFADSAFVTEQGPALRRGDLLVLFTDGVTEAEAADGRSIATSGRWTSCAPTRTAAPPTFSRRSATPSRSSPTERPSATT